LYENLTCDGLFVITVIFSPGDWKLLYDEVFARFPNVHPIFEEEAGFYPALHDCIRLCGNNPILFLVDDFIFHTRYDCRGILQHFLSDESVFNVHLKLHPGIVYSHPSSSACPPPQLSVVQSDELEYPHLQFQMSRTNTQDWGYPVDFCGGMYRKSDILELLLISENEFGVCSLENPNKLETTLNKALYSSSFSKRYKYSLCPASGICSVVTVNRVQTTYKVPIYNSCDSGGDVTTLNRCMVEGKGYDMPRYSSILSISVHVGSLFVVKEYQSYPLYPSGPSEVIVSVILPSYNAAQFLFESAMSILDGENQCSYEMIIIDDGSHDNTPDICLKLVDAYEAKHKELRVIQTRKLGLVNALEVGLKEARGYYVCRMDADDISLPNRLSKLLSFMLENKNAVVVGTQALLFHDSDISLSPPHPKHYEIASMPCHPVLLSWSMYFRCSLLHPTVLFRKDKVLEVGSYRNDTEGSGTSIIEDYDLWTRILQRYLKISSSLPL
jgi:hypothetical protein